MLDIYTTIRIGNTSIETKIEVPVAGGLSPQCWVLTSRSTVPFGSGLKDIISFLGSVFGASFDDVFPAELNSISTFFLDDLRILLDPVNKRIQFLTFRVQSVRALEVGEQLSIRKVGLRVNITPTQASPEISLTLFGQIKIKDDVFLDVQVMLPKNLRKENWIFFMSGRVTLSGLTDIQYLPVGVPTNDLRLHPGFLKLESFDLRLFEVDFNPLTGVVPQMAFDLVVHAECELVHGLKLKDPWLSFIAVNPFNKSELQDRSLTGSIEGTIAVGDINFGVSAEKRERGWIFIGNTATKSIPIGRMISSVGERFGAKMPDFLNGVDLESLTLRFETNADEQDHNSTLVRFDCLGDFPVDDKKAKISLSVDVTRDVAYKIDLSGELAISSLNFKTHYSQNASDNFFTAVYSHTKEQKSIRLKEVVSGISSNVAAYVPESLEVDLKYVLFAYEKDNNGNKLLFGMDLGASLKLSDLPLIGRLLPPDQTIGIDDIQILIATNSFDTALGSRLADILPHESANDAGRKMLQKGLDSGVNISALIRLGDIRRPMDLPISGGVSPNSTAFLPGDSTTTPSVTSSDNVKWFSLQKAFGPVHFNKIGVQYKESELHILLDASITAAGLTLSLDGLSISSPLNRFAPMFHLRGLGIDYRNDAVEIGGALLKTDEKEYAGAAVIKVKQLTLSALGLYKEIEDGHPSMFVYSVLDYPIGGPSFFFVTGLAAGFGYSRRLKIPTIDKVASFSLVENARKGAGMPEDIGAELEKLKNDIIPAAGENFLAIGVKFTSFKIVDSFALLTFSFGNHFEMNLLGLSTLVAPANAGTNIPPVAEAQLALKASFQPDKGFLGVQAQLTPHSYLLSEKCHLTGGFAFYSWFAGSEHDGDFALTLGGYHPNFKVPAHYPVVPRLGFNWQVSPELSLKGDAYFALTASALMAGGHLEANWLSGSIHAWFKLGADFLMAWQPYHYDITAYVDMGVEVTFEFFGTQHLTIDVGADLHLWGPEFSGEATIHLWILSFTVKFGDASYHKPKPIDWQAFKTSFLPEAKAVCSVAVAGGLVGKDSQEPLDLGVIDPKRFLLTTNSVIPSTEAQYAMKDGKQDISLSRQPGKFGIAPMALAIGDLTSTHTITIKRDGQIVGHEFEYMPIYKKVPTAQWGESLTPELNGEQFIDDALSGLEIRPKTRSIPGDKAAIKRDKLMGKSHEGGTYSWESVKTFAAASFDSEQKQRDKLREALAAGATGRNDALKALGFTEDDRGAISVNASFVDDFLIAPQIEQSGRA